MNFEQQLAEIGCACEQPAAQCHAHGPVPCVRPSAMHAAQCQRSWLLSSVHSGRVGRQSDRLLHCIAHSTAIARKAAAAMSSSVVREGGREPGRPQRHHRTSERKKRRSKERKRRTRAHGRRGMHRYVAARLQELQSTRRALVKHLPAPTLSKAPKGAGSAEEPTDCGKKARKTPRRDRTELDAHWPRSSRLRASAGGLGSPAWPTHCGSRQTHAHAAHSRNGVPSDTGHCSGA